MPNSETDAAIAPQGEKLSFWTKAAYAIGDLGNSAGPGTIVPFWYFYFLTDVVKLDPTLAGLSVLLGKLWDAINDPLVGALSDRTRGKWGRRRPYLLYGSVPFGVTFALLWIVPPIQDQVLLCLYFALAYMVFDTAFTFIGCPYQAMAAELTLDHDERTSLLTYRMGVSIGAGLLTAILLGEIIFPSFPGDERAAFMTMGIVCGVIFIVPTLITFWGTRERKEFQVEEAPNPLEGLRYVLRNTEWRYTRSPGPWVSDLPCGEGAITVEVTGTQTDFTTSFAEALTTYGLIGVKTWIYKGDIIKKKKGEKKDGVDAQKG